VVRNNLAAHTDTVPLVCSKTRLVCVPATAWFEEGVEGQTPEIRR
jgi:hypothetical protein